MKLPSSASQESSAFQKHPLRFRRSSTPVRQKWTITKTSFSTWPTWTKVTGITVVLAYSSRRSLASTSLQWPWLTQSSRNQRTSTSWRTELLSLESTPSTTHGSKVVSQSSWTFQWEMKSSSEAKTSTMKILQAFCHRRFQDFFFGQLNFKRLFKKYKLKLNKRPTSV